MRRTVTLLAFVLCAGRFAEADGRAAGPLAALPGRPGPHVARIAAMGGDTWLDLGPPAADPNHGRARGRAWTPRMPYAPELRAAMLCGCGQHGFVKPDGRFMDDLWAYDVPGHRWVCVYPGADTKRLKLHLDTRGFETDAAGRHVPVSYLSHGYCNEAYVPGLGLMIAYTHSPWWTRAIPQRWAWLDANDPDVRRRNYGHAGPVIESAKHPLFYDVAAGRWRRRFVVGDGPGPGRFEGVLAYVPRRKQAFYLFRGRVWWYDVAAGKWLDSGAEAVKIGYDSLGCYDPKRHCVYVMRREGFWAFDIDANRWRTIRAPGQPKDLSNCHGASIAYDTAADAVVCFRRDPPGIAVYRPAANAWSRGAAPPPDVETKRRCVNGFYEPKLNAHFYHLAGDSRDNGFILVYRCRKLGGATQRR